MEFFSRLLFAQGAVQTVLVLSMTISLGILIGRIKICGVSLGIGGILFSGIILGHFGLSLEGPALSFAREFGLILFVFAIGMQVGPDFQTSFRTRGAMLNLMATFIVLFGAALSVLCYHAFDLTIPQIAGIFCGAVTNTPALGSASEAFSQIAGTEQAASAGLNAIGMGYAVAYPFGIVGLIFTMIFLRMVYFRRSPRQVNSPVKEKNTQYTPSTISYIVASMQRTCLVSCPKALKKNLAELRLPESVAVARIVRFGKALDLQPRLKLRLGDVVVLSGTNESDLKKAEQAFGNSRKALKNPQMLSIFLGISLGVLLGNITIAIPGLPTDIKLGAAGGTLLVSLILSNVQSFAGLTWYMTGSACLLMREMGIMLFLACVGLHAGTGFVSTITDGSGLQWMCIGAIITLLPVLAAALICIFAWKMDYAAICGLLSGSMTDPPALAFSMQYAGKEAPATAYASVYPLTMMLRILMGQILVIILAAA